MCHWGKPKVLAGLHFFWRLWEIICFHALSSFWRLPTFLGHSFFLLSLIQQNYIFYLLSDSDCLSFLHSEGSLWLHWACLHNPGRFPYSKVDWLSTLIPPATLIPLGHVTWLIHSHWGLVWGHLWGSLILPTTKMKAKNLLDAPFYTK